MPKWFLTVLYGLAAALCACTPSPRMRGDSHFVTAPPVIFVCEHGAAKSVVAAAYFNQFAAQQHLPFRAVARGLTPQEALSTSAADGLRADGLSPGLTKPIALHHDEAQAATRLVSFMPLPDEMTGDRPVIEWDDVPATGDGYVIARDTIRAHVKALIDALATNKK